MWNNPDVGEELACECEITGNTQGTITSESHAIFLYNAQNFGG